MKDATPCHTSSSTSVSPTMSLARKRRNDRADSPSLPHPHSARTDADEKVGLNERSLCSLLERIMLNRNGSVAPLFLASTTQLSGKNAFCHGVWPSP